jgi:hypothetical protein
MPPAHFFALVSFSDRVSSFCPCWPCTSILLLCQPLE